jgi:uncharacterized membrane protein
VTRYEWLLLLHLIGAFASMGSVVVFSVLMASGAQVAVPQLTFLGRRLWDVGGVLTLVFGVWLALDVDGYGIFDGWILTALLLWLIAGGAGIRLGLAFSEGDEPPTGSVLPLYAIMAVAVTALLVVMIYKPGA